MCGNSSSRTPCPAPTCHADGRGVRASRKGGKHFAVINILEDETNNVDVIIYAVEKSLDSDKFNLLHCNNVHNPAQKRCYGQLQVPSTRAVDEQNQP